MSRAGDLARHLRISHKGWRRTPARTYLLGGLALLIGCALVPITGFADGSRTEYPSDKSCGVAAGNECRAAIEWSNSTYGPSGSTIYRRTLFSVYLKAGEVLELGSSANGVAGTDSAGNASAGDTWVWSPGQITNDQAANLPGIGGAGNPVFKCSSQTGRGQITSRALEQAGPQSADGTGNTGGYAPCTYTAPAAGVFKVGFFGPAGPNSATTRPKQPTGDITMASADNFNANQGTQVEAWDVSVRADAASTTDIDGRVFTYLMSAYTGGNQRPLDFPIYATTLDGFVYRADLNQLDPNAFLIYGNEQGFLDPEKNPLYHDVLGKQDTVSTVDGGVSFAMPQYPISLAPLSADTLNAIGVTTSPTVPDLTALTFQGADSGKHVYMNKGGTFGFDTNQHGTYEIVISQDGTDFDPGLSTNRVLRGIVENGHHTVVWDGKDNAGGTFPAGSNYQVHATMHAGVYHFPLVDAENSVKGGPAFTLTNSPNANGACAFGNDCSAAFYDDRGYRTSAGPVGTVDQVLCGNDAPATSHVTAGNGYDSTGLTRKFGTTNAGKGNAPAGQVCTGEFGDQKALDTWTYFPSAQRTASFTVDPTPTAPVAQNDAGDVDSGATLTVPAPGVLGNDSGTNTSITGHTQPAHGSLSLAANGGYTYAADASYSGTDTFTYTITDDAGQSSTATVTITVHPKAKDDTLIVGADQSKSGNVLSNDNGSGLTATGPSTSTAGGTVALNGNGSYTYTAPSGYSGPDSFTYTATDSGGRTSTATVTITVAPRAVDDTGTGRANTTTSVTDPALGLLANDHGSSLTASAPAATPKGGTITVNGDGTYVYDPPTDFSGKDSITYTATDDKGTSTTATLVISVRPAAVDDTFANVPASSPFAFGSVLGNDHGSNLQVTGHTAPAHGTVATNADGTGSYTPNAGYTGPDSFTYTVTGADGLADQATVHLQVKPVAPNDGYVTDYAAPLDVSAADGVLKNDQGSNLTVTSHSNPAVGTLTMTAPGGDGSFRYVPPTGFSGKVTFTYTATDDQGQTTPDTTVTITVKPQAVQDDAEVLAGQSLSVDAAHGVLSNDHGTGLTVTGNTQPAHGTATVNSDGSYSYTPAAGWSGPDSFTYTAQDSAGSTVTQTVTVVVEPVAVADTPSATSGVTLTVPAKGVLANDRGNGLQVTSYDHTSAQGGSVAIQPSGAYTYTSAPGFSGTDTFTYTITDSSSQQSTATVTVTVAPAGTDDTGTTPVDTTLDVPARGVLGNDGGTGLTVTSHSAPAHGTLVMTGPNGDGSYHYTPAAGFSGNDSFTYVATDAGGRSTGTVTVRLKVTPIAGDDAYSGAVGTTLTRPAGTGVLSNDKGSNLQVTGNTQPAHGSVTVGANGSFSYTPNAGYAGPDSFTYTAGDGVSTTTATVRISVGTLTDDAGTTVAGTRLDVDAAHGLLANDSGSQLAVAGHSTPAHGTATTAADGAWSYTPDSGFSGNDSFTYTARDGAGVDRTATVRVTVTPRANDDSGSTTAGTALVVPAIGVLSNDLGQGLSVSSATQPQHGTVSIAGNGGYTYAPAAGYSGPDSFTYTVVDAANGTATATVRLNVAPTAAPDSATTPVDQALTIQPLGNDQGTGLRLVSVTDPAHGTATVSGNGIRFVPQSGWSGVTTCTYTATDASGQQVKATVTIRVTPVARPDEGITPIDSPITMPALRNDSGTSLTIASVQQPPASKGTVTLDRSDGTLTFTPAKGFTGTVTIPYTVVDAAGQTTTSIETIYVRPVGKAVPDEATTQPGQPVTIKPTANDPSSAPFAMSTLYLIDIKNHELVRSLTLKGVGTFTVDPQNGHVVFKPVKGFTGKTPAVPYQVLDFAGVFHVSVMQVTVKAPVAATTSNVSTTTKPKTVTQIPGVKIPMSSDADQHLELPKTGADVGWQAPTAGLAMLLAGLVLIRRRRPMPAPVRVKGGGARRLLRGTHRRY